MACSSKKVAEKSDAMITEPESVRKLYVGNLEFSTTDENLKSYFEKFGRVVKAYVVKNKDNDKLNRGFGFVIFAHSKTIAEVLKKGPHKINGRFVKANLSDEKKPKKEFDYEMEFLYDSPDLYQDDLFFEDIMPDYDYDYDF